VGAEAVGSCPRTIAASDPSLSPLQASFRRTTTVTDNDDHMQLSFTCNVPANDGANRQQPSCNSRFVADGAAPPNPFRDESGQPQYFTLPVIDSATCSALPPPTDTTHTTTAETSGRNGKDRTRPSTILVLQIAAFAAASAYLLI